MVRVEFFGGVREESVKSWYFWSDEFTICHSYIAKQSNLKMQPACIEMLEVRQFGIQIKSNIGKNIGQQYCWCSLMWLMPLRSLSNCDYELNFYLRLILGPIHSNQVMGTDPVGSHHGTRNSQSNSINPTYPY